MFWVIFMFRDPLIPQLCYNMQPLSSPSEPGISFFFLHFLFSLIVHEAYLYPDKQTVVCADCVMHEEAITMDLLTGHCGHVDVRGRACSAPGAIHT